MGFYSRLGREFENSNEKKDEWNQLLDKNDSKPPKYTWSAGLIEKNKINSGRWL